MIRNLELEPGKFVTVEIVREEIVNQKRLLLVKAVGVGIGGRDLWIVGIQDSSGAKSPPPAGYTRLRSADVVFEAMREVETRKSFDSLN